MKKLVVFALLSVMMIAYSGKAQAAGPQKNTVAKGKKLSVDEVKNLLTK